MRLSEVLRCGYTHGISSLCSNRKRGRVSLEDLREVEAFRAQPTIRPVSELIAAQQHRPAGTHHVSGDSLGSSSAELYPALSAAGPFFASTLADQDVHLPAAAAAGGVSCAQQHGCFQPVHSSSSSTRRTSVVSPAPSSAQVLSTGALQPAPPAQQQHQSHHHHQQQQQQETTSLPPAQQQQDALRSLQLSEMFPAQVLQLAGLSDVQDMQAGQMGYGSDCHGSDCASDCDSEEVGDEGFLELSGGTSDFEDVFSDYGTTEEEEENNSIPPADLEAILAENGKLWGHQQGQQQQEAQQQ